MSTSPNLGLNLQATGSDNGTWGIVLNNNQSVIDSRAGGRVSVDCTGASNITVSGSQAQNFFQTLTGTLTGNIKYILPAQGGQYYIENSTTGAYTITVVNDVSGTGVVIAQNTALLLASNPDNTTVSGVFPSALSVSTLKVTSLNSVGVVTTDASGNFSTNSTLPAGQFPILSGDVTSAGGSLETTIANGVVTLAKMADMATASMLGRATAGTGSPEVLSASAARTNMGLGSAALLTAGTSANNAIQLNGSAQLPAVDGSLLTNLPAQSQFTKAWVNFNADASINAQSGVSGVVLNSTGKYTITLSPAILDANYAVLATASANNVTRIIGVDSSQTKNTTTFSITVRDSSGTSAAPVNVYLSVVR